MESMESMILKSLSTAGLKSCFDGEIQHVNTVNIEKMATGFKTGYRSNFGDWLFQIFQMGMGQNPIPL